MSKLSIEFGPGLKKSDSLPTRVEQEFLPVLSAKETRHRPAIIFNNVETTYAELDAISAHGASAIAAIPGNPIVAVGVHPSDRLVALLVSIVRAGSAYLPVVPQGPIERLEHILQEAQPKLLVVDDGKIPKIQAKNVTVKTLSEILSSSTQIEQKSKEFPVKKLPTANNATNKNDIFVILYTSGSTGVPKGVMMTHANVLHRLRWQFEFFPFVENEASGFKTSLTFIDSVWEIFAPLCKGLPIVVIPKCQLTQPSEFVNTLEKYRIHRLMLVPSLMRLILLHASETENSSKVLPDLRYWISSGETLVPELVMKFYATFPVGKKLCNFYGSTEVTGDVVYYVFKSGAEAASQISRNKVPIGIPVGNTAVYLLDDFMKPVNRGEIGQIWISGSAVARGYLTSGSNQLTLDNRFVENPYSRGKNSEFGVLYAMGDYARMRSDGVIVFEGRMDTQVKVRGHRVDLSEVEAAFLGCPGLQKAVVLCHRKGHPDQVIVGFCKGDDSLNEESVRNHLKPKLPEYMIPTIVMLHEVPFLPNGKIDRQNLLRQFREQTESISFPVPPKPLHQEAKKGLDEPFDMDDAENDPVLKTVVNVVKRSLGAVVAHRALKASDNFFHIGGNSLNAVAACLSLRDAGFPIRISEFLAATDLRQVAEYARQRSLNCQSAEISLRNKSLTNDVTSAKSMLPIASDALGSPYRISPLADDDWAMVSKLISESFFAKGDLEKCLPNLTEYEYFNVLQPLWPELVGQKLSFVVRREGRIVAAALNFDLDKEPEVDISENMAPVFNLLESVEAPQREIHFKPKGLKVIHNFMMGTSMFETTDRESVQLMELMEEENVRVGSAAGYDALFTTNTSPITQQLGEQLGYEVLDDFQINLFVDSNGKMPFAKAGSEVRAVCCVKYLKPTL